MNVLITGGASGLGEAITKTIAAAYPDAEIYFTYHRSAENAKSLENSSSKLHSISCDFNDAGAIRNLCDFITENEVDVLVNNALTQLNKQYFHKTPVEEFGERFRADVLSTVAITQAFILKARQRKSGKIITILTAGLQGTPPIGWSVYLANKSYLLAMHRSWATENRSFGITSNCLSPDFMATTLHGEIDERVIEQIVAKDPQQRLLTVDEVAKAVVTLCGAPATVNGRDIIINTSTNPDQII